MEDLPPDRPTRRIRIHTPRGAVDGSIRVGPKLRTLDDLNAVPHGFVILHDPEVVRPGWSAGTQALAINRNSILFVTELSDFRPSGENRCGLYARASMNLEVGDFSIQGFVHVPPDGDPFIRLNRHTRPFLALTSASVLGPGVQFAAAFLAINRTHITAAQSFGTPESLEEVEQDEAEVRR